MSVQTDRVTGNLRERVGLATVLGATFMGQVDGFIVTVAAPSLQRDLPASFGQVQFVGSSYVLACAAGLTLGGRLGDRFGRRRVFLIGVAVFTLASLLCGLATNPELLIAARCVQGAAAAALIPQELALIRSMFSDDARRARAISAYAVVLGLGVIFGLAGGGLLVHADIANLGWRSVFLLNVPIGVLILLLGRMTIPESRSSQLPGLDPVGAALTAIALPALLLPAVLGPESETTGWIWLSVGVGLVAMLALIRQQRGLAARGGQPIFPPHVLGARGMPTGLAAIGIFFAGNAGLFLVFTYYVQTGLDHDPLSAGLMFVPLGIGFILGSAVSDRIVTRYGPMVPVAGCGFLALALIGHLVVVRADPNQQTILLGLAIGLVGLAQGLVVSPLIAGIFQQVSADDAGAAAGAAATVTQAGLAAGYLTVGLVYRLALGGTPGAAQAPAELGAHVAAYSVAVVVLVLLAALAGLLCWRRVLAGTPHPSPVSEPLEVGAHP